MSWKAVNWKRGVLRLWAFCAICWVASGLAFSGAIDEARYAYRYFVERNSLRLDLLSSGACNPHPFALGAEFDEAAKEVIYGRKESPTAGKESEQEEASCRIYSSGETGAEPSCLDVHFDAIRSAAKLKTQQEAVKTKEAADMETRCLLSFTPAPPTFRDLTTTFLLPTAGIGLLFLAIGLLYLLGKVCTTSAPIVRCETVTT